MIRRQDSWVHNQECSFLQQGTQKTVRLPAHPTGLALAIIDFSVYLKNGFFVSSALKFCPTTDLEK